MNETMLSDCHVPLLLPQASRSMKESAKQLMSFDDKADVLWLTLRAKPHVSSGFIPSTALDQIE